MLAGPISIAAVGPSRPELEPSPEAGAERRGRWWSSGARQSGSSGRATELEAGGAAPRPRHGLPSGEGGAGRRRARPSSSARRTSARRIRSSSTPARPRWSGAGEEERERMKGGREAPPPCCARAVVPPPHRRAMAAAAPAEGGERPRGMGCGGGGDATLRCGSQATQNGFRVWVVCWSTVLIPKYTVQNLFWV